LSNQQQVRLTPWAHNPKVSDPIPAHWLSLIMMTSGTAGWSLSGPRARILSDGCGGHDSYLLARRLMRRLSTSRGLSPSCGSDNRCASGTMCRCPGLGNRRVQSSREIGESGCGAMPAQLLNVVEERDVGPEGGERTKKQCIVLFLRERLGQNPCTDDFHSPLTPVLGNGFEMRKLGKDSRRRLRTPALQSRIPVCGITHQS